MKKIYKVKNTFEEQNKKNSACNDQMSSFQQADINPLIIKNINEYLGIEQPSEWIKLYGM